MMNDMKQTVTQYAMVVLLIVGAYFLGVYKTRVEYLQKGVGTNTAQVAGQQTQQQQTPTTVDINKVKALFADSSNLTFGNKDSKILFVEFSDPSCPYCHAAAGVDGTLNKAMGAQFTLTSDGGKYQAAVPEIRKLVEAGKAAFAWVFVPGHGNGEMGTMALYCANEQGKFWQAHDLLMSEAGYQIMNGTGADGQAAKGTVVGNDRTKSQAMATFLKSAADPTLMKNCLDSKKYEARLTSDPQIGSSFNASATPTFLVNEHLIEGADAWNTGFQPLVESLL